MIILPGCGTQRPGRCWPYSAGTQIVSIPLCSVTMVLKSRPCPMIRRCGCDLSTIGTEHSGIDTICVPAEYGQQRPGLCVPQPGSIIIGCRHHPRSVPVKRSASDIVSMSSQHQHRSTALGVPQAGGLIIRSGENAFAVEAEYGASDRVRMPFQLCQVVTRLYVPESGSVII